MGARVSSRHPSKQLSVVDDEVAEGELVRVEEERRDGERQYGDPEVNQVRRPYGQGDVEQEDEGTKTKVDRRSSESRVQDTERDSRGGKSSSGRNVSSTSKVQVVQNRVGVDLGGENLEDGRERHEVLGQPDDRASRSTFRQLLQEERQEGDKEDDEDGNDASLDPLVDGDQVVTTGLAGSDLAVRIVSTDEQLLVHGTQKGQDDHEYLDRQNDQDVIDVETGVSIVESEEPVNR